jgi:WD40 repeat protein
MVAAGGLDKTIRVWSLGEKSATLIRSEIAHEDAILRLAFSPDGKTLVSASADRSIKVFRTDDLVEIKSHGGQPDWVFGLEFSPDGRTFAAGRYDGSLTIYPSLSNDRKGVPVAVTEPRPSGSGRSAVLAISEEER